MKISVCMATYNGEKYIREQLDSIIIQLSDIDEIIISDDSSTDKTIDIIESYNDKRIKIFKNNRFYNPCFNFENALKNSTGDIIFLSDQDDIWEKDKVKICLEKISNFKCLMHNSNIINSKNIVIGDWYSKNKSKKGLVRNIIKNSYLGCAMVLKRELLEKAIPFPKDTPMHDVWLGLVGERNGSVIFIEDRLIKYRRHEYNFSSASEKSKRTLIIKIKDRLILIKNFLKSK